MSIIMRVILVIMQIAICIVSKNCNFRAMVLFSSKLMKMQKTALRAFQMWWKRNESD